MVVEGKMILKLKSVKELNSTMEAQLLIYLRLSKIPLGYLINFRSSKETERSNQASLGCFRSDAARRFAHERVE